MKIIALSHWKGWGCISPLLACLMMCSQLQAQIPVTIGTASTLNDAYSYPSVYGNSYWGARHQILIPATELLAAGMVPGRIMSVGFDVVQAMNNTLSGFQIKMKHTNESSLNYWHSGLQTVYTSNAFTDVAGWNLHPLDSSFSWDGVSSLIIESCFNNDFYQDNPSMNQTETTYPSCLAFFEDGVMSVCAGIPGWHETYYQRPDIRFILESPYPVELALLDVVEPRTQCGMGANQPLSLQVANYGTQAQSGFTLGFSADSGLTYITEIVNTLIQPGDTLLYTFSSGPDLSLEQTYHCVAYVNMPGDAYPMDDTLSGLRIVHIPTISGFPYFEDFETSDGSWMVGGNNASWELGSPSGYGISQAASGTRSWVTNLYGNYNDNEASWVVSPCFDFSGLSNLRIAFHYFCATVDGGDGAALQYQTNGVDWMHLGSTSYPTEPEGWYQSEDIEGLAFSGSQDGWVYTNGWDSTVFMAPFLGGESQVRFRFVFGTNQWDNWDDGFGFDAFSISQPPDMTFDSCLAVQKDTSFTSQGRKNQEILQLKVITSSSTNPLEVSRIDLSTAGSTDVADINRARVFFTGADSVFSDSICFGSVLTPSGAFSVNGVQSLAEGTNYFWLTYDITAAAIPGNAVDGQFLGMMIDDTFCLPAVSDPPGKRIILEALAGNYTISLHDSTADYAGFASAIADLTLRGIVGAVTMLVDSGTYEEQLEITDIYGASPSSPLLFRSAGGDSSKVILQFGATQSAENYVLSLYACQSIHFEELTFVATGSSYARIMHIKGATDSISFVHCHFIGPQTSGTDWSNHKALILADGAKANHRIEVQGCRLEGGTAGTVLRASAGGDGCRIIGNVFEGQTHRALYFQRQTSLEVQRNTITSDALPIAGASLELWQCEGELLIGENVLQINSPDYASAIGMHSCIGDSLHRVVLRNNFICMNSSANVNGISISISTGADLLHNTILLSGDHPASNCVALQNSNHDLRLINNILSNEAGGTAMSVHPDTDELLMDYNVLYSSGNTLIKEDNQLFQYLPDWSVHSGMDVHSVNTNPWITYCQNEIYTGELDGIAYPLAEVAFDIHGIARDTLNPDPGCLEFTPETIETALSALVSPVSSCGLGMEAVMIRVQNIGADPIAGLLEAGFANEDSSVMVLDTFHIALPPLATVDLLFDTLLDLGLSIQDTNYLIRAYARFPGDQHPENDTLEVLIRALYLPPPPSSQDVMINGGEQADLFASSSHLIYWYESDTSESDIASGGYFKTPVLFDSTSYFVASSGGSKYDFTTTYAGTVNSEGMMVDVRNHSMETLRLDSLGVHLRGSGQYPVDVYYKEGSYSGSTTLPDDWIYLGQKTVNGVGLGNPSIIKMDGLVLQPESNYAFYVHSSNSDLRTAYGSSTYENEHLQTIRASSLVWPFGYSYSNRKWNGSFYYSISNSCFSDRTEVRVDVMGSPLLQLSDSCIDFDTVMLGEVKTSILSISNVGDYTLIIDSITAESSQVIVNPEWLRVYPGMPQDVSVSFIPLVTGLFQSELVLHSNAGKDTVCLTAVSSSAVVAGVNPASFQAEIYQCNDSVFRNLIIQNLGAGFLSFSFYGNYGFNTDEISEITFVNPGATMMHTFSNLPVHSDSLCITIVLDGDYEHSSEYADLFIEGVYIARLNPSQIQSAHTFCYGSAQLESWLSDGALTVSLENNSLVDPGTGADQSRVHIQMPGVEWLKLSQDTGLVAGGDSIVLGVRFDGQGMMAGLYHDTLRLRTNDPLLAAINIPCSFRVNGTPDLLIPDDSLVFDPTMAGQSSVGAFSIENTGCDTLFVSDIVCGTSFFTPAISQLMLPPGQGTNITLSFSPDQQGHFSDTVFIFSNSASQFVLLAGTATSLPGIALSPTSFEHILACETEVQDSLLIMNQGDIALSVSILVSGGAGFVLPDVLTDSILPGDTALVFVSFVRENLGPGTYYQTLSVSSNDPANPLLELSCALTILYPYPHIEMPVDTGFCEGDSVWVEVDGGFYSYDWNSGHTTPGFFTASAGSYVLSVTNVDGCMAVDSIVLSQYPNPVVDAGIDKGMCAGYSTTLDANITGGSQPYAIEWVPAVGLDNHSILNPSASPLLSTQYVLLVEDHNACVGRDTMEVIVNPTPQVTSNDYHLYQGDSVLLTANVTGGVLPYFSMGWSPASDLEHPDSTSTWAYPSETTQYQFSATGANGCVGTALALISVSRISQLSGTTYYGNDFQTPMSGIPLYLYNEEDLLLDSTISGVYGDYQFDSLLDGRYIIQADIHQAWGGVNATDALEIQKAVVGLNSYSGLLSLAADVNAGGFISSADALIVLRRFTGLIDAFTAGDWVYNYYAFNVLGMDRTYDIIALCVGDVNRSYLPGLKQEGNRVGITGKGSLTVEDPFLFDLPIFTDAPLSFAALSLVLLVPDEYELAGLETKLENIVYHTRGNELRVAWQNPDGLRLTENEPLFWLKMKSKSRAPDPPIIQAMGGSEFAGTDGQRIPYVSLKTPLVVWSSDRLTADFFRLYPNPASQRIQMDFSLTMDALVEVRISNMMGEEVMRLPAKQYAAGNAEMHIDAGLLPAGVYLCDFSATHYPEQVKRRMKLIIQR